MDKEIIDKIEAEAGVYAEKIAFRVPYDGTNIFYDNKVFEASKRDYIAGRSKAIEEDKKKDERIKELEDGLKDLIFTATKLWDEVKPIKDGYAMKVTHPTIEQAKQLLK